LVAGPLLASAAHAQASNAAPASQQDGSTAGSNSETAEGPTAGTEEIVVTAEFRERNLQQTPLAITAVTAAMLEARSQTNLSQIANQAPSVTLKSQSPAFGPSMGANIRGVGQFDFNPAFEPGVGLYVDDVYYPTLTGAMVDLLDVDRVEVLRGPQGTLAGKNSIGGAIKLYSKRPRGTNTGFGSVTYGSRNRLDLRAAADFSLGETVSARFSAVSKEQDGYVKSYDFGCVFPAGGSATFVDLNGVTQQANPSGGIPAMNAAYDKCLRAKEGDVGYQAVRGQLRFTPDDRLDINLTADYTREDHNTAGTVLLERFENGVLRSPNFPGNANVDINPYGGVIPFDRRFLCGPFCNYANYYAPADTSSPTGAFRLTGGVHPATDNPGRVWFSGYGFSGDVRYDLSENLQLVSISAYRSYETSFDNDDDLSPLAHTNNTNDLTFRMFSQELRLSGTLLDDALEYTLGGFYLTQKSVSSAVVDIRYAGLPIFANNDPVHAKTSAAFAHVAWKPMAGLTLTAGLRYTDEYKRYTFSRRAVDGGPLPPGTSVIGIDGRTGVYDGSESNRFDYRANVQYEVTPTNSIYAQVSTGFKGGGINPRPFNEAQVLAFAPETLTSYEIGTKNDLLGRRLRINIAAYFAKYQDLQLKLSNCTAIVGPAFGAPCSLIVNAGDADIKGFEVESTFRPFEGMLIDGSLSLVDFDYKSFASYGTASAGGPGNPNGPQFGDYPDYVPRWKWSIGAQYTAELGELGRITPRFDIAYQSEINTLAANRPTNLIEAYHVANARLTWENEDGDLEISAEVTNLFDKYYFTTVLDYTLSGAGLTMGQPGRPREFALTVKKSF
jgi:iron complex outermembrane receptor protein